MRKFKTGATRDTDIGKNDYEGFIDPLVIKRFGDYMSKHRIQADGKLRDSDNWKKGIPKDAYIKSAWRHFLDWWMEHRGYKSREGIEDALCALMFNVMGYLYEILKNKETDRPFIITGNHTIATKAQKIKKCNCKKPTIVEYADVCGQCGGTYNKWNNL